MATEIYTPPAELPITSRVYRLPWDGTGTVTYEDPNKVLFLGDVQIVGNKPTVVVVA